MPLCITRDKGPFVTDVSIRGLRNHGGEVIDRVLSIRDRGTERSVLARWPPIPGLNFDELRSDLASSIHPRL